MFDPNTAPPPRPSPAGPKRRWGALAVTLLAIGLLILIPSGLCTGILGVGAIYEMITEPASSDGMSVLSAALMVGGIPIAIGVVLVLVAFAARK